MIQFVAELKTQLTIEAAAPGEQPRRTIRGLAAPYNVVAVTDGANGPMKVRLLPGSLPTDGTPPIVIKYHDVTKPVGVVTERVSTDTAMMFQARILETREGDEALIEAAAKVLRGVSVGINPTKWHYDADQVMNVEAAEWGELSLLTFNQAFKGAMIYDVAASIPQTAADLGNNQNQPKPQENANMETAPAPTAEQITAHTAALAANTAALAAATTATAQTPLLFAEPKRSFRMPSATEYVAAFHIGGDTWKNVQVAFRNAQNVNANPLHIQAAAGDILTTDTPGIIPVPILGPVFQDLNFMRPVVTALGARPMPSTMSKTFVRPTVTTHTSQATQTEGSAVSRTTMVIASNVVTKTTVAGGVTITYQDLDWTDPNALQIVMSDMAGIYLDATDNIAADNLLAAATTSGVWDLTLVDLVKSFYDAAVDIYGTTNFLPTDVFVDPATWALVGQLTDLDGRLQFPNLMGGNQSVNSLGATSPGNNVGGNVLGLNLVVDKNFAAKTMVICNKNAFEIYEEQRGTVSVENATLLARDLSLFGYFATFRANATMIRKITQA